MGNYLIRRLGPEDWKSFHEIRMHMFRTQPREFRSALEDEEKQTQEDIKKRLTADYVAGATGGQQLLGVAGISRIVGRKLQHKGLLWGMYVRSDARGAGIADALMKHLIDCHSNIVETITLTVAAHNERAIRFYQRWGYRIFGTEPRSIRVSDSEYLDEHLMYLQLNGDLARS